jgi:hypothetical protein
VADKFTFDGPNLRIRAREDAVINGVFSFSIYELYSEWKRWMQLSDNTKYLPAFRTVGGDPIGGGQYVGFYLFMRNDYGWRGVPPNIDGITVMIEGSFFGESANTPVMEMISGNTTSLIINRSSLTQAISTSGVAAPTALENAAAVLAAAQVSPIHSNIKRINNTTVIGSGVEGNTWGPA